MQQTKIGSLIESLMNIAIGYGGALLSQIVIFPLFGIHVPLSANLWIGAWFTVISLVRSYVIRRWFNARIHMAAQTIFSWEAPMTWAVVGKFAKQKRLVKDKHLDPCEACFSTYPCEETCGGYPRKLRDGEPCGHPGCLHHVTHPCEGYGRIGGHSR